MKNVEPPPVLGDPDNERMFSAQEGEEIVVEYDEQEILELEFPEPEIPKQDVPDPELPESAAMDGVDVQVDDGPFFEPMPADEAMAAIEAAEALDDFEKEHFEIVDAAVPDAPEVGPLASNANDVMPEVDALDREIQSASREEESRQIVEDAIPGEPPVGPVRSIAADADGNDVPVVSLPPLQLPGLPPIQEPFGPSDGQGPAQDNADVLQSILSNTSQMIELLDRIAESLDGSSF